MALTSQAQFNEVESMGNWYVKKNKLVWQKKYPLTDKEELNAQLKANEFTSGLDILRFITDVETKPHKLVGQNLPEYARHEYVAFLVIDFFGDTYRVTLQQVNFPDFEEKIVYLEDVEEKTYRMDKMLFHLLSGTNLKKAAGIILGACDQCNVGEAPTLSLTVALDDLLKPLEIPVSYGLSFGHIKRMITIPTGVRASMDADKNSFELLEAAVI